ncbi:MAG: hypothetical protein JJU45_01140 [Acidimicrobiia bacterium]|nr:hypothetical protein [Acidimicrobiia bacterium]
MSLEFDQPLIDVTMLLADSAQVADGKLYVLGGGLAMVGPKPQPVAVAMLMRIPWDRANLKHNWKLELVDEDGQPVMAGQRPLLVQGNLEAGRPAGLAPGTPLPVPMAINFSALPLPAGRSFEFRLAIDDTSEPEWVLPFSTRPAPDAT